MNNPKTLGIVSCFAALVTGCSGVQANNESYTANTNRAPALTIEDFSTDPDPILFHQGAQALSVVGGEMPSFNGQDSRGGTAICKISYGVNGLWTSSANCWQARIPPVGSRERNHPTFQPRPVATTPQLQAGNAISFIENQQSGGGDAICFVEYNSNGYFTTVANCGHGFSAGG